MVCILTLHIQSTYPDLAFVEVSTLLHLHELPLQLLLNHEVLKVSNTCSPFSLPLNLKKKHNLL